MRFELAALLCAGALVAGLWRGASYDAAHRCPEDAPEVLRGVAVEVRVGTFGDRVLTRGENGVWGFVASVASGEVAVGERVEVSAAAASRIEDFLGDGGQVFPYANLMRSRGYCFEAKRGTVKIVGESDAPLDRLRALGVAARGQIGRVLPPVAAALSAGALLGGDDGVGEDLEEASRRAGLAHALALSGFNVGVFAGAVDLALRRLLPRRGRILGGTLAGWLLVALAGLPASGVRAALAWSVGSTARLGFRPAEAPRALLYATLVFAWWNPLALAFDISLQLSVLACLGIAAWASAAADKLVAVPGMLKMREAVAATLAATATTLPIMAWSFGQVSVVSPLANAVVAYFIPLMMWAGLAAVFVAPLGAVATLLAPPLALPAQIFAAVALWSGSLPWAAVPISISASSALWGSLIVSAIALASIARARRLERERWQPEIARLKRAIVETF